MWLIDREGRSPAAHRIKLPAPVRDALVRWYTGNGSRADEEAGIVLVQQARIGRKWLACDCLGAGAAQPILTPAFLSEAETYYLRRLTGADRPEHEPDCPFFRDQATNRITSPRGLQAPADPPGGFFEALRPAPEKLAQRPKEEAIDDRTRQASVPRMARLLWRLIDVAGLNRCPPPITEHDQRSILQEFRTLSAVTAAITLAPGIELQRAFWTHADALHSRRIYSNLRALAGQWPRGHAPQGFLALFAHRIRGSTIYVADGAPVVLANRVQSPSTEKNPISGPYLVLIVVGEYPETRGFAPLRGYAQPILSGQRFIPVDSASERETLKTLIALRGPFARRGIDLFIEKPVFDILTPLGPCRPSFLVEARTPETGECRSLALQIFEAGATEDQSAGGLERLQQIARVLTLRQSDLAPADLATRLVRFLDL